LVALGAPLRAKLAIFLLSLTRNFRFNFAGRPENLEVRNSETVQCGKHNKHNKKQKKINHPQISTFMGSMKHPQAVVVYGSQRFPHT
jgi:hypothetical protein